MSVFLAFYLNRNFYLAFTERHTVSDYRVKPMDQMAAPTIALPAVAGEARGRSPRTYQSMPEESSQNEDAYALPCWK